MLVVSQNTRIWGSKKHHEVIQTPLNPEKRPLTALIQKRIIDPIFLKMEMDNNRYLIFIGTNFLDPHKMENVIDNSNTLKRQRISV